LDSSLGLDGSNSGIDILWNDISSEEQGTSHVLAKSWITFNHLVVGFETTEGHVSNGVLFVLDFIPRDDRSIGSEREVNSWERYQVGLELVQIDVQSTIESEGSSDGRDNLSNQSVQIGITRASYSQILSANVVNSFVVNHERAVDVFQGSMGSKNGIVRLDDGV